ncbi:MAG: glycoside hydrolase family 97 protein, partial [Planctomycetes bacterium]|nr:glycoside hydrolase family 97 protein [Planctomycetota bacterium]
SARPGWRSLFGAVVGLAAAVAGAGEKADIVQVTSPDGNVQLVVSLLDGQLVYSIDYNSTPVIVNARLGLKLADGTILGRDVQWSVSDVTNHNSIWTPVYGERSRIRDHYRAATIRCTPRRAGRLPFELLVRVYNEGAALAYRLLSPGGGSVPSHAGRGNPGAADSGKTAGTEARPRATSADDGPTEVTIVDELTEFAFPSDLVCWPVYSAQGIYKNAKLSQVRRNCERPLLVEFPGGPAVAVGEARLVDYARMRLQPAGRSFAVRAQLASEVEATLPYTTPWRVILLADNPCQLIERNYLILNLNDPCRLSDTSWIRPGKVIREVTLSTKGGKACVDFAVKMGLSFVEYDAGWYGHEYDERSDATTVTPDPKRTRNPDGLDLHEVIRYAKQRGIGVILYVNRRALERQLDDILPLYQKWGVAGVKYGFVQVGSQKWTRWLHDAVRKAAEHRLMVDVHDEYRPMGFSRTYPNLMTQEGIRGNETMPTAEHNTILPFTRGLCGAGDYTICWYTDRIKTTHAHQLACAVVFYSPWQFVFWYDRPAQYRGEPETLFFKHVPTVWEETRVLAGRPGEFIVMARRRGNEWYVGWLNAVRRRRLKIPLGFLDQGCSYEATLYTDASPEGTRPFEVAICKRRVVASDTLAAEAARNGGCAVRLVRTR